MATGKRHLSKSGKGLTRGVIAMFRYFLAAALAVFLCVNTAIAEKLRPSNAYWQSMDILCAQDGQNILYNITKIMGRKEVLSRKTAANGLITLYENLADGGWSQVLFYNGFVCVIADSGRFIPKDPEKRAM